MNRISTTLACAAMMLAAPASSFALVWSDVDSIYKYLSISGDNDYEGTFNILSDGYNPGSMYVSSAVASFAFADGWFEDSASEYVNIYLGGNLFLNNLEVDGTYFNYDWRSGALSGSFLAGLQDGIISYKVVLNDTAGVNNTWLKQAKLVAYGDYKQVPDGASTAMLLGIGLIGLSLAAKRRLRR